MPRLGGRRCALAGTVTALLLSACSGGSGGDPVGLPSPPLDCPTGTPEEIPAACVEGPDGALPAVEPSTSPPARSRDIAPVSIPAVPNELARGGNDADPERTSATFTVTVPKGARLRSDVTCDGSGTVVLTTLPKSGAEQEFPCTYEGDPFVLTVQDPTPQAAATSYTVTVRLTPPGRWFAVLSYTTDPPAPPVG